jgi:ATP phosphoribosyltransferase
LARWPDASLALAGRLLSVLEARARAKMTATLVWPAEQDGQARTALAGFGEDWRASGLLVRSGEVFRAAAALADAGVGPVTATRPEYVFDARSDAAELLEAALAGRTA